MKVFIFLTLLFWALLIGGCATTGGTTLFGSGLGLAAGAAVGFAAYPGRNDQFTTRNVIVGSAVGGIIGAGIGFLVHQLIEKNVKEDPGKGKEGQGKNLLTQLPNTSFNKPVLLPAKVESRFVDEVVRGGIFVPAHVEYFIVEPARWSR